MRNLLDASPKVWQTELKERVRAILDAPDLRTARLLRDQMVEDYEKKATKAMQVLEDGFDDATAVLALPKLYRKRLRTTNGVERLNQEVRRRERVIRIFPNEHSVVRLIGAVLMEIDEKWSTGHRYLNMETYWRWREEQEKVKKQEKTFQLLP
jgi:putative transposase